jgi:hypothetical protein
MKKLFVGLILVAMFAHSVSAQLVATPEGAVVPNGAFHYIVPGNMPAVAWGGSAPWGMRFPVAQAYPLSYPLIPIPMPPPGGSTSDRISPMPDSDDATTHMR